MSNKKAFFLGFFATCAIILPLYLGFAAFSISIGNTALVDNNQVNVPIAQAGAKDVKNVLIICEDNEKASYTIVRFDALENKIAVVSILPQTIMLSEGQGVQLHKAQQSAGPAQAAACIEETLSIGIDNYIKATPAAFAKMCRPMGIAQLLLANYINEEDLAQLKLSVPGIEDIALSPQRFAQVLGSGLVPLEQLCAVRADGYLAFLRAGQETLHNILPRAVKEHLNDIKTNITATDIYDYERILKFLSRELPEYKAITFSGKLSHDRYELSENTPQEALDYFA